MVTFQIEKTLAEIGEGGKRLTLTSWNGNPAKLDLRKWKDDGTPGRGMTLTNDEARELLDALTACLGGE